MKRQFILRAWGTRDFELDSRTAAALQASGLVRCELGARPGEYRLRADSYVGVASGTDWELRIDSHLDVSRLLFLLCYARDPTGWRETIAGFERDDDLLSSIAAGFASAAERALRGGVLRGYQRIEERTPVLRGRMQVSRQVARGGLATPVDVARDEYTEDIAENQMLLAAADSLGRLALTPPQTRRRLRRVMNSLDGASVAAGRQPRPVPRITRLNAHYRSALVLADIVLRQKSLDSRAGEVQSATFAFELHRVFEQFLFTAFRARATPQGVEVREQASGRYLDRERLLHLRPDFVFKRGGQCVAVADAKFKRLEGRLAGDAYQMLAYLLEFGPARGFLISAEGAVSGHAVLSAEKQIEVRPIDLALSPDQILGRVDELFGELSGAHGAEIHD
ncbi:MAG: hypothetical protein Q7T55_10250 [Solirubrobacteraceae bacterium]|nr:hypothetical protein [Solirubrobacteraceae bacterium]